MVWDYAKLTLLEITGVDRRQLRLLGFRVAFDDVQLLRYLFEEIALNEGYRLTTPTRSPVIIDAGANLGFATLYFKWRCPHAQIHCFEPNPASLALLRRNVELNGLSGIHIHGCALGDAEGEVPMTGDGLAATIDPVAAAALRVTVGEGVAVKVERLSTHLRRIGPVDTLKLDIEGAEVVVLEECAGLLATCRQLILEFHQWPGSPPIARILEVLDAAGHEYEIENWLSTPAIKTCLIRSRMHEPAPSR